MYRRTLLLLLLFAPTLLAAQDTLLYTQVDTLPSLSEQEVKRLSHFDRVDFDPVLAAFYQHIRYPRIARENGVMACVPFTFVIDTSGVATLESVSTLSLKETEGLKVPKDELLRISTISSRSVNNGPSVRVPPPSQTQNLKRLAKAHLALAESIEKCVADFPNFLPGWYQGQKVVVRYQRYALFYME